MFQMTPQTKVRALFYLVFTVFGLFHAEVLSRSQPWVLIAPWWFLLVAPVYACHYVVLGDLLLRRRATGFFPVFIAGCILGMYEFVITKVFWLPSWTPFAPRVLEVAWMEVFWVGFWWHAFMSFAIPFFLVRKLVLERHPKPLQIKEIRWVVIAVPLMSATFGTAFGAPPYELLASVLMSLVVLFAMARFFLEYAPQWGFKGTDDVLLSPKGRKWAIGFLIGVYAFYGATMRLEALPSLYGLLLPAPFYLVLFAIFLPLVRAKPAAAQAPAPAAAPPAPVESSPAPAAPLGVERLRQFIVRYAMMFTTLILLFAGLAILAPWVLFILYIFIVLQGGVGAAVFLAVAGGRVLRGWVAERRPAAAT